MRYFIDCLGPNVKIMVEPEDVRFYYEEVAKYPHLLKGKSVDECIEKGLRVGSTDRSSIWGEIIDDRSLFKQVLSGEIRQGI